MVKMKLYNTLKIKKNHKNSIILIGNFDGLHLGHQKLFRLAKRYKKKYSSKIGVLTFEPMPKMFFNSNLKNFRLSNLNQKIENLSSLMLILLLLRNLIVNFQKQNQFHLLKKL